MNRIISFLAFLFATTLLSAQITQPKPLPERINLSPVTDVEGNTYPVIRLGTQVWMAANLKTSRLNDGVKIDYVPGGNVFTSDKPGYCFLRDNPDLAKKLGFLYNFAAVSSGKVCPEGWHVPSDAEWTTMENYLISGGYDFGGNPGGVRIAKALADTVLWSPSNVIGAPGNKDYPNRRNATGFSALPTSRRGSGVAGYDAPNNSGYWWSSTQASWDPSSKVYIRYIWFNLEYLKKELRSKYDGHSIRCIKN